MNEIIPMEIINQKIFLISPGLIPRSLLRNGIMYA